MGFMITSEMSKQYLLEEDAVKGFEMAVNNGQSRLALSILVDVMNGIMEVFNMMMEEETPDQITLDQVSSTQNNENESVQEEKKTAEKKKSESKKQTEVSKESKNEVE